MARAWFFRGSEDFFVAGPLAPGDPYRNPAAGFEVTFWDAETGGTQWDDLLLGGTTPVTSITVTDPANPPAFQGPDGVVAMWVQVGGSTTRRMIDAGADIAIQAAADREAVAADRAAVEAIGTTTDSMVASLVPTSSGSATSAALTASYAAKWKPSTAYTAGDVVVSPSGRLVERVTSGTSGTTYTDANWRGVRIRVGERGFPDQDPSGYTKISLYHDASNGMVIPLAKVAGDSTDVNIDGAINGVKHGKDYVATPGYADTVQYYTLAGSAGTILGNNNFVELGPPPYTVPGAWTANGFVRFELGPVWPDSERMRLNNRGDLIHGDATTVDSVITASQTGTTVTRTAGPFFSADSVGKFLRWQGRSAFMDRVTAFIDADNVTVETSRTLVSQAVRQVIPKTVLRPDGKIETHAGLKIRTRLFQTGNLTEWLNDIEQVMAFVNISGKVRGVTLEMGPANAGAAKFHYTGSQLIIGDVANADGGADVHFSQRAAGDKALVLKRFSVGATGNLFETQDETGAALFVIGASGRPKWAAAANEQTTVGAAGAASALPATPTKYLKVTDSAGNTLVIPAYASA